jgi:hypothetical protein
MASSGGQVFEMKNPYDSSSGETITNLEVGLMGTLEEYGDVKADLADMQRLGKKQEFDEGVLYQSSQYRQLLKWDREISI